MSTPFLSEIKIVSFGFAPQGWALCNGQTMPINQNQALFSLVGTTFGGNGINTFSLPNLQGNVPMHQGNGLAMGNTGGETSHTLITNEIPNHTHLYNATSDAGNTASPVGATPATAPTNVGNAYAPGPANTLMSSSSIGVQTTSGQAHTNMQPYIVLNFVIALQGIFPSQN